MNYPIAIGTIRFLGGWWLPRCRGTIKTTTRQGEQNKNKKAQYITKPVYVGYPGEGCMQQ